MNRKTEAVSVVRPDEAELVDYPKYQRIRALAESPPSATDNKDRILYVSPDWAGLVDRTRYDKVEVLSEQPLPPKKITLSDALLEQYERESGTGADPDAYLYRHRQPPQKLKKYRDAEMVANQPEKLN